MIGIGVSTTPKREVSEKIERFKPENSVIEIFSDVDKKGVSVSRNTLLVRLKECDHIFLFDDDCYPVMYGWAEYFIEQCEKHGVQFCQIPESFKSDLISVDREMGVQSGSIGCFTYLTKAALETIGGFSTEYVGYGFEDAEYKNRAIKAGLTGSQYIKCPIRALAYIHSEDVFAENPTPNLSFDEKLHFIQMNQAIFDNSKNNSEVFREYGH